MNSCVSKVMERIINESDMVGMTDMVGKKVRNIRQLAKWVSKRAILPGQPC